MDQATVRARLIEERDRLDATTGELAQELDIDESQQSNVGELASVDQHSADAGSETFEREKDGVILTSLRERRSEIEAALQRLENGAYGMCEECDQPIGDDRLEAFPAARFCIEHQSAYEAKAG